MLVFGDRERSCDPRAVIEELARALDAIAAAAAADAAAASPLARHGAIAGAFVDAGELAQALADAAVPAAAPEARTGLGDAAMRVLAAIAATLARSWDGRPVGPAELAGARAALAALAARELPASITLRAAEGYAYYALYPEAYLEAARAAVAAAPGPRCVIGIRSIGAGLAAIVAEACAAPLPATVRPRGDPHRRRVAPGPALAREWATAAAGGATFAIVDEGPGLSGSSFGAVIDAVTSAVTSAVTGAPATPRGPATKLEGASGPATKLEGAPGPALDVRIELYPGHAGEPGPAAAVADRARWRRLPRRVVPGVPARVAARALAELAGPLAGPLEDLSAGAWRARRFASEDAWPPVVAHQERCKLLARAGGARWVARFAGLGRAGAHALRRARELAAAGLSPPVAGLGHGFLVERWLDDAAPLDPARYPRERLIEHLGRYFAFRRRAFPADASRGASPARLLEMMRRNASLALGAEAAEALERWRPALAGLAARARPIEVDARLHPWEWLVAAGGRLIKTDGVDHHAGHDLVGCQDVAWDVAGAITEFSLAPAEARRLLALVDGGGATRQPGGADPIDRELLAFLYPAYLAFQLGRHALAIDVAAPDDATRLRAAVDRYAERLRTAITTPGDLGADT